MRSLIIVCVSLFAFACNSLSNGDPKMSTTRPAVANLDSNPPEPIAKLNKSNEEWRKLLTAEQYDILREQGTEPAFHNAYFDNHEKGTYLCAACGLALFSS